MGSMLLFSRIQRMTSLRTLRPSALSMHRPASSPNQTFNSKHGDFRDADKATVRCGCADVRSRAAMRRGYFLVTQDLSTNSIQITTVQTLPCAPSNSNVIMCLWHNINDASAKPLETLRSIFLTNIASSCMIKKQADFFCFLEVLEISRGALWKYWLTA